MFDFPLRRGRASSQHQERMSSFSPLLWGGEGAGKRWGSGRGRGSGLGDWKSGSEVPWL